MLVGGLCSRGWRPVLLRLAAPVPGGALEGSALHMKGGLLLIDAVSTRRFAEEAVSGRLTASEVAERVESVAWDAHLSGAAHMARAWLSVLPLSQFIRRVFAWYVSLWSGYRVLPFRQGNAFDAAVDGWDPSEESMERLRRRYGEVRREGASCRGSLLAVYVVLKPHDGRKLADVVRRVRGAVASDGCGGVWFMSFPLPPECELGECDV